VFEMVKREAERYGVVPTSSEIVGLIPKKVLEDAAEWFLKIEDFDSSMIIENRLAGIMGGKMAVGGLRAGCEPFIEQLAAPTATPGGGSASAAAAAMAAGLGVMVASMSRTKKAFTQYESQLSAAVSRLNVLREHLKEAIDKDAESYRSVMIAFKTAKDAADNGHSIVEALKLATLVPLAVAEMSAEVGRLIESIKPISSINMASDLGVGTGLATAAKMGALANVDINIATIKDEAFLAEVRSRVTKLN